MFSRLTLTPRWSFPDAFTGNPGYAFLLAQNGQNPQSISKRPIGKWLLVNDYFGHSLD
jgi:hypothetical protein